MHKIWLIARREYLDKVRTKAFIFTTILFPLLIGGMSILPQKIMTGKRGGTRHIVVVTSNLQAGEQVRDILANAKNAGLKYEVEISTDVSDASRSKLRSQVSSGTIDGFLWADDASVKSGEVTYVGRETSDLMEMADYELAVSRAQLRQRLASAGIKGEELDQLLKRVSVDAVRVEGGKESKGGGASWGLGIGCAVLIYVTTLIYGIQVMRSVLEEKSSRIVEVLLATVSAKEMMAGKIIGVAAAGLTQLAIWATAAGVYLVPSLAAASSGNFNIPVRAYIFLPIFFLLGFLIYASLYAALAAAVNTDQEAQQFQTIIMLPLIFTMVLMYQILRDPNGSASIALSIFPFTAPVLMYMRIVVSNPSWWQIAASIGVMAATFAGIVVVCAKIYRVGILMYGKRPTLPEIVKWLRYA